MDAKNIKSLKLRMAIVTFLFLAVSVPPAIAALVMCLPYVGNFAVVSAASHLGCFSSGIPCYVLGHDISGVVRDYEKSMWVVGLNNPAIFIKAISRPLPLALAGCWIILVISLAAATLHVKSRLLQANNSFKPKPLRSGKGMA